MGKPRRYLQVVQDHTFQWNEWIGSSLTNGTIKRHLAVLEPSYSGCYRWADVEINGKPCRLVFWLLGGMERIARVNERLGPVTMMDVLIQGSKEIEQDALERSLWGERHPDNLMADWARLAFLNWTFDAEKRVYTYTLEHEPDADLDRRMYEALHSEQLARYRPRSSGGAFQIHTDLLRPDLSIFRNPGF